MHLNGQRLPIKSFQEYVDQYLGPKENGVPRIYERFSDRWEVCISTTEGQVQQVRYGGTVVVVVMLWDCGTDTECFAPAPPRGSSCRCSMGYWKLQG